MLHHMLALGKGVALCAAVLFTASSVQAQTSPSGHVPARTAYVPRTYTRAPSYSVYPGDRMFQATMKIQRYYQNVERMAPVVHYYRPVRQIPAPSKAEGPVAVTLEEPAGATEMVTIRGPKGEVRAFPLVGGRKAIKVRTIIVRPGQSLHLTVRGGRVESARK